MFTLCRGNLGQASEQSNEYAPKYATICYLFMNILLKIAVLKIAICIRYVFYLSAQGMSALRITNSIISYWLRLFTAIFQHAHVALLGMSFMGVFIKTICGRDVWQLWTERRFSLFAIELNY